MEDISVKFVDFWRSLNHVDNKFTRALSSRFNVRVLAPDSSEKPDLLFYSVFGVEHYKYEDCVKIYFTGENDVPDFNECDYAMSFHHIDFDGRHLRYPLYMMYEISEAVSPAGLTDSEAFARGFCSLLMRNSAECAPMRLRIIDAVENYRPITYGGPFRNNIGSPVPIDCKIEFIAGYKFNLALENSSLPGYVTEKIVEPFAAPTVPIYWGAPDVNRDFNPRAFINVSDYATLDSFIRDLDTIDKNPERYLEILRAPRLNGDNGLDFDERLAEFLCKIAEQRSIRRTGFAQARANYRRNRILRTLAKNPKVLNLLGRLVNL